MEELDLAGTKLGNRNEAGRDLAGLELDGYGNEAGRDFGLNWIQFFIMLNRHFPK